MVHIVFFAVSKHKPFEASGHASIPSGQGVLPRHLRQTYILPTVSVNLEASHRSQNFTALYLANGEASVKATMSTSVEQILKDKLSGLRIRLCTLADKAVSF